MEPFKIVFFFDFLVLYFFFDDEASTEAADVYTRGMKRAADSSAMIAMADKSAMRQSFLAGTSPIPLLHGGRIAVSTRRLLTES